MFKEMMDTIGFVTQADPEVGAAMEAELKRQRGNIELINFITSAATSQMVDFSTSFSIVSIIMWGGTSNAPAIRNNVSIVGLRSPRSILL